MRRNELWHLAIILVAASAALYLAQLTVFHKPHDTLFYLMQDLAFMPLSVLFVTLVVDRILAERERASRAHKMNMVIGTFFAGIGDDLMRRAERFVTNLSDVAAHLAITPSWTDAQIREATRSVANVDLKVTVSAECLTELRSLVNTERDFLLRLLENPILLEHETFTDMLWAIFHVQDELSARKSLEDLPHNDMLHLANDIDRAYTRLLTQWLGYMLYLRNDYPFLFSLAARTNPLRPDARAEVD